MTPKERIVRKILSELLQGDKFSVGNFEKATDQILGLFLSPEEMEKIIREYRYKIDDDAKGIYIGEDSGRWEEKQDKELAESICKQVLLGQGER